MICWPGVDCCNKREWWANNKNNKTSEHNNSTFLISYVSLMLGAMQSRRITRVMISSLRGACQFSSGTLVNTTRCGKSNVSNICLSQHLATFVKLMLISPAILTCVRCRIYSVLPWTVLQWTRWVWNSSWIWGKLSKLLLLITIAMELS